jgi:acyl-CoA-binding protein
MGCTNEPRLTVVKDPQPGKVSIYRFSSLIRFCTVKYVTNILIRPGILNIDGRLKWDAWVAVDGLSVEEARQAYVDLAKELIGTEIVDSVLTTS